MGLEKELGRKAVHLSWGIVLLIYLWIEKSYGRQALYFPFILLLAFLLIDFLRVQYGFRLPIGQGLLHEKETRTFFTPTTTMIAITIALAVFKKEIAVAAILMMVFGDLAAHIGGKLFGRTDIGHTGKTLEGGAAGAAVSLVVGTLALGSLAVALPMALTATIAELYTKDLDDNLFIILFAGLAGQLMLTGV